MKNRTLVISVIEHTTAPYGELPPYLPRHFGSCNAERMLESWGELTGPALESIIATISRADRSSPRAVQVLHIEDGIAIAEEVFVLAETEVAVRYVRRGIKELTNRYATGQ